MADTIDWPPQRKPRRRRGLPILLGVLAVLVLGGGALLSYYVDALWFESLGVADVFWTTLRLQGQTFTFFFVATFLFLYGAFLALKPAKLGELAGLPILINGQPIKLPVEPVIRLAALGGSLVIAAATGAAMMSQWNVLALYRQAGSEAVRSAGAVMADPIFGRPLTFYLFTLPAWQMISGWLMTLSVIVGAMALFFVMITDGSRLLGGRRDSSTPAWRGLSIAFAFVLLMLAARVYLGRFERLFDDHTIFAGVTYTEAHVTLTGSLIWPGSSGRSSSSLQWWMPPSTPGLRPPSCWSKTKPASAKSPTKSWPGRASGSWSRRMPRTP